MKFLVYRTSDCPKQCQEVEFSTLEEFIEWCKSQTNSIIIDQDSDPIELEVYDQHKDTWP